MTEYMKLAELRKPSTPGHQDLREWKFRDELLHNDTSTILAWANNQSCILHQALCSHVARTEEPTAKGRMDEARELFALEQSKGTFRYFGFCGHCLVERVPNYGWQPTVRDVHLLENLRQRLRDMKILGEQAISRNEMILRMKRYSGGNITPAELNRLLQFYKELRSDDEDDLSALVVLH